MEDERQAYYQNKADADEGGQEEDKENVEFNEDEFKERFDDENPPIDVPSDIEIEFDNDYNLEF